MEQDFIFTALKQERRSTLPTHEAAFYLDRAPQTLRACEVCNTDRVKCLGVNGRLAWPVAGIFS